LARNAPCLLIHGFVRTFWTVVLNQGSQGSVKQGGRRKNSFQVGTNPYALHNMESLINKFTKKYICFTTNLIQGAIETKDNYLR